MNKRLLLKFIFFVAAGAILPAAAQASWWDFFPKVSKSHPKEVAKIWIFDTEFTGELATRLAVADQFPDAEVKLLKSLPSEKDKFTPEEFLTREFGKNRLETSEWPDLIIHSFIRPNEAELILSLKRLSKNKIFVVNFDDPGPRRAEFDLIVQPRHLPPLVGTNVTRPMGLPTRLTPELLDKAKEEWAPMFGALPRPIVSVFVGGQTKEAVFTAADAKELGSKVAALTRDLNGSILASNSRRTPAPASIAFGNELTSLPVFATDWKDVAAGAPNPYMAMFAYADYIVITGDSLSMLSDAVSTGKPVYVFAKNDAVEDRHRRLIVDLYQSGRIRILGDAFEPFSYDPLAVGSHIRSEISRRRCDNWLQ